MLRTDLDLLIGNSKKKDYLTHKLKSKKWQKERRNSLNKRV
jgi:hypothetical protein